MELTDIANVLFNYGIAGIVLAYALWKDKTFTDNINKTMTTLSIAVDDIKDILNKEKEEK